MVSIYEWYIDIFFVVNFLMDTAGLLAAGILCNLKIRLGRLVIVCAGATACSLLLFLCLPAYLLYLLAVHLIVNPLMVAVSYSTKSWWDFCRPLLTVYLVLFVAGGVQQSLRLYGMDTAGQVLFSGFLAIGMFSVWQVRQRVMRHVCLVELELLGERISLTAFYDSGNLLRDPETGREVSILMRDVLPESWLEPELLHTGGKQNHMRNQDPEGKMTTENFFGNRKNAQKQRICTEEICKKSLRRISYTTVGTKRTEMEIITLDKMRIYRRGRVCEVEKPMFGLFDGKLIEHPDVGILLNGAYA